MDREEILKMAQAEKYDEQELQIKDKSMTFSYVVIVITAAIFSFIRSQQWLPMMDLTATVAASVCATSTYRFIKTRKREYFLIALTMIIVAIISTVRFFMGH